MNWDNYYHDGADEINDDEYDDNFGVDEQYTVFNFAKYLADNNITIDWLNPDSMISEHEACEKFFNIEFHISKTFPTDIGYSKPQEY